MDRQRHKDLRLEPSNATATPASTPELPQEWPTHLQPEASISPDTRIYPRTTFVLDFAMPAESFEQLCWWLLSKEQPLGGCHRLGKSGTRQGGIDLFAHDEESPDRLNVFECKAWKDFTSSELTGAIDAFLNGPWPSLTRSFTLILAQREIGTLASRWINEKQRLKAAGIEGRLWTAHELTQKLQHHPDVLSKFFPGAHIETFGNLWMERVGFSELVAKSIFDPRPYVARKARAFVERPGRLSDHLAAARHAPDSACSPDAFTRIGHHGRHWYYRGPWFSLSVFLPDLTSSRATAAFDFHQHDLRGVTITVSHEWLLERFLFASGAPLDSQSRPFIVGLMPGDKDRYLIDLPNSRLILEEPVVQALADVADALTVVMRDTLQALERSLSASGFAFIAHGGSHRVKIGSLRKHAWRYIARFCEAHDYAAGTSPWHMFDAHPSMLKPCHAQATDRHDSGYHALITTHTSTDAFSSDWLDLLWTPHDLSEREPSSRGWWPCQDTLDWLDQELLPEVRRWTWEREFGSRWRRLRYAREARNFAGYLDYLLTIGDVRERALVEQGSWQADLPHAINRLERYYAGRSAGHIDKEDVVNLYRAVAMMAGHKRGLPRYLARSLSLEPTDDHEALMASIHRHIETSQTVVNNTVVEYALKALGAQFDGPDCPLQPDERQQMLDWLLPLAHTCDDGALVRRHSSKR
ncbi:hypothetical protein [Pseudomonas sp. RtIB026]|uniref:hypothetical protein n=1 Tax=Pseudomonas sp. RtIB026 TaxID=2749999 RepID=UPI00226EC54B|nr:hypothetical protein [Pseudomonas sp. RtIB026]